MQLEDGDTDPSIRLGDDLPLWLWLLLPDLLGHRKNCPPKDTTSIFESCRCSGTPMEVSNRERPPDEYIADELGGRTKRGAEIVKRETVRRELRVVGKGIG